MQFRERTPVTGVVYNTTLSRPDAALTLALLYGFEGKREARVASVAITENSLGAAIFADAVFRFYQLGPVPNANRTLPIGLAADKPLPPDSVAVKAVLERADDEGKPVYKRAMRRVSDTAEVTALMRNSLAYIDDGWVAVVLSAPATHIARTLDSAGARELIQSKVRTTIVSECKQDPAAMRRMLAEWPAPMVFCGRDVGEALPFPAASIEQDFAWTTAHPVADFYRAFASMPYDTPAQDLAAALYAVRPQAGFFQLSPGTIEVLDDGGMRFVDSGDGKHKRLTVDPAKKEEILTVLREVASAKPVPPPPRRRFTPEEIEKFRKQQEEDLKKRELEQKKATATQGAK